MAEHKDSWGPAAWTFLHYAAFFYPDKPSPDEQKNAKRYVSSLPGMLPCPECNAHATAYINANPPDLSARTSFSKWTVAFHNVVNSRLGKPRWSYQQALEFYNAGNDSCACGKDKVKQRTLSAASIGIVVGLALAVILYLIYDGCGGPLGAAKCSMK